VDADVRAGYERMFAHGAVVQTALDLMSARGVDALGLDELSPDERAELEADFAEEGSGSTVVDVTTRRRTARAAQVEVIVANPDGTYDGALDWARFVLEDGHWRDDDRSEPSEDDGESRESQAFEAVGQEISADGS
jgi:hypothetical protein